MDADLPSSEFMKLNINADEVQHPPSDDGARDSDAKDESGGLDYEDVADFGNSENQDKNDSYDLFSEEEGQDLPNKIVIKSAAHLSKLTPFPRDLLLAKYDMKELVTLSVSLTYLTYVI